MIQLTLIPTKFQDVIKISEEDHNMWISVKKSKTHFHPIRFFYLHSLDENRNFKLMKTTIWCKINIQITIAASLVFNFALHFCALYNMRHQEQEKTQWISCKLHSWHLPAQS